MPSQSEIRASSAFINTSGWPELCRYLSPETKRSLLKDWYQPLPPTYEAQLKGLPGFRAWIAYSIVATITNKANPVPPKIKGTKVAKALNIGQKFVENILIRLQSDAQLQCRVHSLCILSSHATCDSHPRADAHLHPTLGSRNCRNSTLEAARVEDRRRKLSGNRHRDQGTAFCFIPPNRRIFTFF